MGYRVKAGGHWLSEETGGTGEAWGWTTHEPWAHDFGDDQNAAKSAAKSIQAPVIEGAQVIAPPKDAA